MRRTATLFLALAALAVAVPGANAAGPKAPLSQHGTWITDARGRTVITHGVNMVYKLPPYAPAKVGFNGPDAAFLAHHGFDSVRLGLIYAGVEPKPGKYDDGYLRSIRKTQHVLAKHHIFSLLDFHQDLYNEKFTGEGFPAWAVLDNGLPAEPLTGFPYTYFSSPGENASWDNLWADAKGPGGVGVQERYAAAWREVAARVGRGRYVMGYDPINEPWPGNEYPTCLQTQGCPLFETGPLATLEAKVVKAIRRGGGKRTFWYEPVVTANSGTEYYTPHPPDPNAGFNFHDYCLAGTSDPPCDALEQRTVDLATAHGAANDDPLLLSEFGATDDLPTIQRMVNRSDDAMISWQWWHYCGCDDPTTSGPGDTQALVQNPRKAPRGKNVFRQKLAVLDRPYPQAVAGTPASYSFDTETGVFALKYSTKAPAGKRLPRRVQTVVYIPRIHYPHGYSVAVKGARVTSKPGARYLELQRGRGPRGVTLTVSP